MDLAVHDNRHLKEKETQMKTLLDIVDNGRRLVSIEYTNEDIAEINAGLRRRQEALQREYDILN